jgi:hypothetical protein
MQSRPCYRWVRLRSIIRQGAWIDPSVLVSDSRMMQRTERPIHGVVGSSDGITIHFDCMKAARHASRSASLPSMFDLSHVAPFRPASYAASVRGDSWHRPATPPSFSPA